MISRLTALLVFCLSASSGLAGQGQVVSQRNSPTLKIKGFLNCTAFLLQRPDRKIIAVTAAHCLANRESNKLISAEQIQISEFKINHVKVPKDYFSSDKKVSEANDVAVLKLNPLTKDARKIRPYFLARQSLKPGDSFIFEGYGLFTNDDDGDGVHNADDLCPMTPINRMMPGQLGEQGCLDGQKTAKEVLESFQNRKPAGDEDQDGVANQNDYCENTPRERVSSSGPRAGCSLGQLTTKEWLAMGDLEGKLKRGRNVVWLLLSDQSAYVAQGKGGRYPESGKALTASGDSGGPVFIERADRRVAHALVRSSKCFKKTADEDARCFADYLNLNDQTVRQFILQN